MAQNKYENSDYGFKINFPDTWTIKKSSTENTIIKAVNLTKYQISYISIAAYPIPAKDIKVYENISPIEMFNALKEEYSDIPIELISSGLKTVDGKRAVWTKVKMFISGSKYLIMSTYHILYKEKLFRITNATDGGEKLFDELVPIFERSTYSIDFK